MVSPKKRILIVQGLLPHYRKEVFNKLAEKFNITVLHSGPKTASIDDKYAELTCPTVSLWKFKLQIGVLKYIFKKEFDAVILMFDLWWILSLLPLILPKRIPILLWGHRYSKNELINWLKDVFLKFSDAIILYTNEDVPRMVSRGFTQEKIFVANNSINVNNHCDTSSYPKASFIYVGRLQFRKELNQLIRTFAEIINELPKNIRLDIIGNGVEKEILQRIAFENGISDRVFFHGEVIDDERLKQLFSSAYAYVSPGHVGLGVLHSFAYGVPVITLNKKNHAQEFFNLVNNKNSLIVDDYNELSSSLIEITENSLLTKRLGNEAYFFYSNHCNIEIMVDGFNKAISKVFSEK